MNKQELMEEVLRLGIEVAKWRKLADYGLFLYTQTRMVYGDAQGVVNDLVQGLKQL